MAVSPSPKVRTKYPLLFRRDVHLAIVARGKVETIEAVIAAVDAVTKRYEGVALQLLDPAVVYSSKHLDSAVMHAERAFAQGTNSAKTLATELLLYVTGERRVEKALERGGLRPGLERTVVVGIGQKAGAAIWGLLDRLKWSKDPAGIPVNPAAMQRLELPPASDAELAVLERVALLDVRK